MDYQIKTIAKGHLVIEVKEPGTKCLRYAFSTVKEMCEFLYTRLSPPNEPSRNPLDMQEEYDRISLQTFQDRVKAMGYSSIAEALDVLEQIQTTGNS